MRRQAKLNHSAEMETETKPRRQAKLNQSALRRKTKLTKLEAETKLRRETKLTKQ